jgi:hypothetical protein
MNLLDQLLHGKTFGKSFCSCSPSPPPTPNYELAAKEQGAANLEATRAGAQMNNPNVINPYGTQTVTWGKGFDQAGYDNAVNQYNKQLTDYSNAWNQWAAGGKNGPFTTDVGFGAGVDPRTKAAPDKSKFNIDANQATIVQQLSPDQQALLNKGTQAKIGMTDLALQGTDLAKDVLGKRLDFGQLPQAPGSAEATRAKVLDAMMSRINEDAGRQEGELRSRLLASGITPSSKAYNDAMALEGRKRTDASNQAYLASGQEMTRDFQTDTERRRNALGEMMTERQTPINEITALMSGSQVQNPFAMPGYAQNNQVQAAPLFAAQNMAADYNTDIYNTKAAQAGNLQQGLFGLGSSGIMAGAMMSDRRLKSNIVRIGEHPLGIGWYEYDIEGRREQGVMADELEQVKPEAVTIGADGYQRVYYDMIGGR